ncbi:hypothetical protein [Methanoregula sp.]|jgi:hypothetical protein
MTSLMIDADTDRAARDIQGAAAAIESTVFRDAEPFDAKKAVTDVIAS